MCSQVLLLSCNGALAGDWMTARIKYIRQDTGAQILSLTFDDKSIAAGLYN